MAWPWHQIVGDFRGKSRRPALKFGSHAHALSSSSSRSNSSDMRDRSFCSSRTSARLESSAAGGAVASGRCACFARCSVWSSAEAADACTSSCRNDTGGAVASGRCCVCSARCSAWSARRGCAGPRRSPISAFQFIVPWTYELQRDLCCRAGAWTGYVTLLTECAAWLCWVAKEAAGVPISSLSAEGREASILFCSFLAFANGVIFLRPMSLRWLQQSTRSSTDSSSTEKRPRSCCGVVGGHWRASKLYTCLLACLLALEGGAISAFSTGKHNSVATELVRTPISRQKGMSAHRVCPSLGLACLARARCSAPRTRSHASRTRSTRTQRACASLATTAHAHTRQHALARQNAFAVLVSLAIG